MKGTTRRLARVLFGLAGAGSALFVHLLPAPGHGGAGLSGAAPSAVASPRPVDRTMLLAPAPAPVRPQSAEPAPAPALLEIGATRGPYASPPDTVAGSPLAKPGQAGPRAKGVPPAPPHVR